MLKYIFFVLLLKYKFSCTFFTVVYFIKFLVLYLASLDLPFTILGLGYFMRGHVLKYIFIFSVTEVQVLLFFYCSFLNKVSYSNIMDTGTLRKCG